MVAKEESAPMSTTEVKGNIILVEKQKERSRKIKDKNQDQGQPSYDPSTELICCLSLQ